MQICGEMFGDVIWERKEEVSRSLNFEQKRPSWTRINEVVLPQNQKYARTFVEYFYVIKLQFLRYLYFDFSSRFQLFTNKNQKKRKQGTRFRIRFEFSQHWKLLRVDTEGFVNFGVLFSHFLYCSDASRRVKDGFFQLWRVLTHCSKNAMRAQCVEWRWPYKGSVMTRRIVTRPVWIELNTHT